MGFIYCGDGDPPVKHFKGFTRIALTVYTMHQLERVVEKHRIQKIAIEAQNIPIPKLQGIINKIISLGRCSIEFIPTEVRSIHSLKPIILVSALATGIGKTQLCRYFINVLSLHDKKVSLIIPIFEIDLLTVDPNDQIKGYDIDKGPNYEFTKNDTIPKNVFSQDLEWQIQQYQRIGVYRVFVVSDIRQAIIKAEQQSDVVLYDSFQCEMPFIKSHAKFCVVSWESLNEVRKMSLWPGLVNINAAENIVVIKQNQMPLSQDQKQIIGHLLGSTHQLFHVNSTLVLDNSSGMEVFAKKVMAVGHSDATQPPSQIAITLGAAEVIDPSPFLVEGLSSNANVLIAPIPHAMSPTYETEQETRQTMDKIAQTVNTSDADVVIVSLPRDIPGINYDKQVLYASPEISDNNQALFNWVTQFFASSNKPPLQSHFESQVDILMSMASAVDRELFVTNNQSANREAFCRLFLSSHLPPSFRVTTGEIVDAYSNTTGQLDVVIVNDSTPIMTIDMSGSVIAPILADNVLAVVEVKTSLTVETCKKALSQLRPVKALMPTHGTLESPSGEIIEDPLGGKILTGIFAFNPSSEIENKVPSILSLYPHVADFIVLPDSFGYFSVSTLAVCGISVNEADVHNGYIKYTARGMGLAIVFGMLNSMAAIRRFSGSNCVRYLNGSWGGKQDAVAQISSQAKKALNGIGKIVVQNIPKGQRGEFFGIKNQLDGILNDIHSNLSHHKDHPHNPPTNDVEEYDCE